MCHSFIIFCPLQAMNGFLIVLSSSGEFVFISNSIEDLLGLKKVCTWYLLLIIQCAHIDVDSAVE